MKTPILIVLMVGACFGAFAQGTVNFANIGGIPVTNSLTGQRAVVGTTFRAQLYWAANPGGPPAETQLMPLEGAVNLGPAPGYLASGKRTVPVSPPGALAWFQVRCWETAYGATFEQALASPPMSGRRALTGKSNIIAVNTADTNTVPPEIPASLVGAGLGAITLVLPLEIQNISVPPGGGSPTLTWSAIPGRAYRVQFKPVLDDAIPWSDLSGSVSASGPTAMKTDTTIGSASQRFYRIFLIP